MTLIMVVMAWLLLNSICNINEYSRVLNKGGGNNSGLETFLKIEDRNHVYLDDLLSHSPSYTKNKSDAYKINNVNLI